jgi:hypothetical protein
VIAPAQDRAHDRCVRARDRRAQDRFRASLPRRIAPVIAALGRTIAAPVIASRPLRSRDLAPVDLAPLLHPRVRPRSRGAGSPCFKGDRRKCDWWGFFLLIKRGR